MPSRGEIIRTAMKQQGFTYQKLAEDSDVTLWQLQGVAYDKLISHDVAAKIASVLGILEAVEGVGVTGLRWQQDHPPVYSLSYGTQIAGWSKRKEVSERLRLFRLLLVPTRYQHIKLNRKSIPYVDNLQGSPVTVESVVQQVFSRPFCESELLVSKAQAHECMRLKADYDNYFLGL